MRHVQKPACRTANMLLNTDRQKMQERQVKDLTAEGGRDHVKRRHDVKSIILVIIESRSCC